MKKLPWKGDQTTLIELALAQHKKGERVDCKSLSAQLPCWTPAAIHTRLCILRRAGQIPRDVVVSDPTVSHWRKGRRIPSTDGPLPNELKPSQVAAVAPSATEGKAVLDKLSDLVVQLLEENSANQEVLVGLYLELRQLHENNAALRLRVVESERQRGGPDPALVRNVQAQCKELIVRFAVASRSDRQAQLELVRSMLLSHVDLLAGLASLHSEVGAV